MNKRDFSQDCQCEPFTISFLVKDNSISSKALRSYLLQLEKLVDSINYNSNHHYFGPRIYDSISIDVIAIEPGSVKLPLLFKKFLKSKAFKDVQKITENPTAAIIIGNIIVHLLLCGSPNEKYDYDREQYVIDREELYYNIDIPKAVKEISRITNEYDGINGLKVTHKTPTGEEVTIDISKSELSRTEKYMNHIIEEHQYRYNMSPYNLEILSPSFDDENALWRFLLNGKIIEAEMLDKNFLQRINSGELAFCKGDRIEVDMTSVGKGKNKKYYIKNVRNCTSNKDSQSL